MKSQRLIPGVAAALIAGAALLPQTGIAGELQAGFEFRKLDANHDGFLSRGEAPKDREFSKAFAEADDNRDRKLDPDEFIKAQSIASRYKAATFITDSIITAEIKAGLIKDPQARALDVRVTTVGGRVSLAGVVRDRRHARRAVEIASGVKGVVSVRNTIAVKG
jgi:hypothetical protein